MYTYTSSYTHIHADTRTCAHTEKHTHARARARARACECTTCTCVCERERMYVDVCRMTVGSMHVCMRASMYVCMYMLAHKVCVYRSIFGLWCMYVQAYAQLSLSLTLFALSLLWPPARRHRIDLAVATGLQGQELCPKLEIS